MNIYRFYEELNREKVWKGRIDDPSDRDSYRWHQVVEKITPKQLMEKDYEKGGLNFCFIGFCCDAGIELNLGRVGASKGPRAIREQMCNLPVNFAEDTKIYDIGNIVCTSNSDLQEAQMALASLITLVKNAGFFPVVLGGGHEVAYGNYHGVRNSILSSGRVPNIGIINFDAHFDMRPYDSGINSGTMFKQIADECSSSDETFHYMVLGIQKYGNTRSLFTQADKLGVKYVNGELIKESEILEVLNKVHGFMRGRDDIHLTICTDVFASTFAPGVSAPQPFGIDPKVSLGVLRNIIKSGKVASIDIAEVSPRFDEDNITSKLASILLFEMLSTLVKVYHDEI